MSSGQNAHGSSISWLPVGLEPVAMRLGRADALTFELARVSWEWSFNEGRGALMVRQVESSTPGMVDAVLTHVHPVPPSGAMLFSEVINHLRAALDNVVFHLVAQARGQALPDDEARLVAFPIYPEQTKFADWAQKLRRKVPELGDTSTDLYQRIESLQPFSSAADVPSLPGSLALLMGVPAENEHALLLLQGYSNEDKHRALRLAVARSSIQLSSQSFHDSDRSMRPLEVGEVLASTRPGDPVEIEANPGLTVERPTAGVWVSPASELTRLLAYVADVAIPTLITGSAATTPLPRSIELGNTGQTLTERIEAGRHVNAQDRMAQVSLPIVDQHASRPATVLRTDGGQGR